MELERQTRKQCECSWGGASRCLRSRRFPSECCHLSSPLRSGHRLPETGRQLHFQGGLRCLPFLSLRPCRKSLASLTDSDRLSYQNMGPGPHCDWLGRTMGLEESSRRETIIRHFKNGELNATHSWQFLFMTSNNCLRCGGKPGKAQ